MSDRAHEIAMLLAWLAFGFGALSVVLYVLAHFTKDKIVEGQLKDGALGLSVTVALLVIMAAFAEFR